MDFPRGLEGQQGQKRKRTSRKGLPLRFSCEHPGCEKAYSRAEHLHRHALNHEPKEVYHCQVGDCRRTFVRQDLYDRHVERHQQQSPSAVAPTQEEQSNTTRLSHTVVQQEQQQNHQTDPLSSLGSAAERALLDHTTVAMPDWSFIPQPFDTNTLGSASGDDGFAAWLLSPPGSHGWDLDVAQLPSLAYDTSLNVYDAPSVDCSMPLPISDQRHDQIFAISNGHADHIVPKQTPVPSENHVYLSSRRLGEIISLMNSFYAKHASSLKLATANTESLLFHTVEGTWPNLHTSVLERCISAFWSVATDQIPIVHQPTFSAEHCPVLLLLAVIPLGAAQLIRTKLPDTFFDLRNLADLIITGLRWEIHTHDDAQPPVKLWVAQALLLLEFYEKMFTSRQLHERAHIHHVSTLTLLRRGSPLGGRPGAETPLEASLEASEMPSESQSVVEQERASQPALSEAWWRRWASNEAMLRVVFFAYTIDTLHAAMFGHESSLLPSDVGLLLPCDDVIWRAQSAEQVHQLEATFNMYGIQPLKFLDGLKKYLHGSHIQSHYRARLTLVIGLFSVACHIRPKEKHVKFFESVPSQGERKKWTSMMLEALDRWKDGLDDAVSSDRSHRTGSVGSPQLVEPTVLYHLAYITTHVDILDCQILAGSKLLLGRRVTKKELARATYHAASWATTTDAVVAVRHSFKLLATTLIMPGLRSPNQSCVSTQYSCRSDPCINRPWSLYLAVLSIWTFYFAMRQKLLGNDAMELANGNEVQQTACDYISCHAEIDNADDLISNFSYNGCNAMLQYLSDIMAIAEPEILVEASRRLRACQHLLNLPTELHHSRIDPSSP